MIFIFFNWYPDVQMFQTKAKAMWQYQLYLSIMSCVEKSCAKEQDYYYYYGHADISTKMENGECVWII